MGSKVLLLLISAISLVQVTVSVDLHLVKINKTWSEAQSYCREHYTDLVSIRSAQEVEKINTTVQDVQTERVWIGLFRNNTSQQWQWSNGDYFMYLNWENNAPNTNLYAVAVGKQWLDKPSFPTSYQFYFMCQKVSERASSALKGYYLVEEMKSWTDAQEHCRNNGSELASIRSPEEQEALNTVNTETNRFVWIGFYRESDSQPWKWSNGDPSSFQNWDSGDPDLSNTQDVCVSMNGNASGRALGFWDDRSCTERFYFLCSGGERRVLRIYITVPEERDPEDPQIRDAILAEVGGASSS
ncbi:secretory phospholipase A2 receptor-like [Acipenser oxyrinchus oxyrinchus]|uniref:Secretory phospholipase A2 receptor-like n=1 Tax=Acipenser oxyrinchus oxyrinchus TaxID=40147 RepID=A0AAD8DCA9_ACIOX|nr:secretory phospholipase A2 receptor-like [Acipenser oxyrinchus oxyrinchus]